MTSLLSFAVETLREPAQAARRILAQSWSNEVLGTAFFLAVVLNAFVYGGVNLLFPLPAGSGLPQFSVTVFLAASFVVNLLFCSAVTVSGRWLGGAGRFRQALALLIWLQMVQVGLQVVVVVVTLALPLMGALLNLGINLVLVFVILHFLNELHGFASLWRAFGVLLMAAMLVLFFLVFILGAIGLDVVGFSAHV